MSDDLVYQGVLEAAFSAYPRLNARSEILRLTPDPSSGDPPRTYHGLLRELEYFVRTADGAFRVSREPLPFRVDLPIDYCRSVAPDLQFRVLGCPKHLFHPNALGGIVCLGDRFRPSTSLEGVVYHAHQIFSCRIAGTDHAFDPEAADFFLKHQDEVGSLRSAPLWRRRVASAVRVQPVAVASGRRPGAGGDA